MKMNNDWLGKTVSLDCGSLGFFQGVIQGVHLEEQTITIKNVFQNGIPSKIASITLRAQDIHDLKFLETSPKAVVDAKSTVQVVKKRQRPVAENLASNSVAAANKNTSPTTAKDGRARPNQSPLRLSPRKTISENVGQSSSFYPPRDGQRTPSSRRERLARRDEDCFGAEMHREDFTQEFDFEKNLALFDKRLVFEEIDATNQPDVIRLVDINRRKQTPTYELVEPKFRNDQNVIDAAPINYRQIKTGQQENIREYVTDTGIIVPSIDLALRNRLMSAAEARGFSKERISELVARSGTELSIQLLGGARRLTPANSHQFPLAVILSGPGKAGSYGIAIARHLATQGVRTVTYIPELSVYPATLANELNLYKLCCKGGTKAHSLTHSVTDLPKSPVDLVVVALDDHDTYEQERRQDWHKTATKWSTECRAPILAIDPVPMMASHAKASLMAGLPIWHPHNTAGAVYLVNLALPSKVYKDVGISFVSPFGAKSCISLHSCE